MDFVFLACSGKFYPNFPQYKGKFWQFDSTLFPNRSTSQWFKGQQQLRIQKERNRPSEKISKSCRNSAHAGKCCNQERCKIDTARYFEYKILIWLSKNKTFLKENESDKITYPQMPLWPTTRIKWISYRVVDPKCDCRREATSLRFYRATPHPRWEQKATDQQTPAEMSDVSNWRRPISAQFWNKTIKICQSESLF